MERKEKAVLIALIVNVPVIALRFYLAALSGSIGLAANAWHSLTDVFVTSVVFAGLVAARLGAKTLKTRARKVENVLALFVALFIFYMGIELLADALSGEGVQAAYVPFAAAGAFVGAAVNYGLARYKIRVGRETGSQSLIADGYHSKMDMYCSLAVLAGLLGLLADIKSLDAIAAAVAMLMLLKAGGGLFLSNVRALIRREPDAESEPAAPESPEIKKM